MGYRRRLSPSFFYVYANGLNVPEHIDYGGWGGRFSLTKTSGIRGMDFIVRNGKDENPIRPLLHAPEHTGRHTGHQPMAPAHLERFCRPHGVDNHRRL